MTTTPMWGRTQVEWTYTDDNLASEIGVFSFQWGLWDAPTLGWVPDPSGLLPGDYTVVQEDASTTSSDWTTLSTWKVTDTLGDLLDPASWHDVHLMPALQTYLAAIRVSSVVKFTKVSSYFLQAPGKGVIPGSSCVSTWTTPPVGEGGTYLLPPQVSVGVSTQSPQLGRKGRGRWYLPPFDTMSVDEGAVVSETVRAATATASAAFLHDAALLSSTGYAHVLIPIVTGHENPTKYGLIEEVRVSCFFDTQRRRRDRLEPTYDAEPVTYG